MTRYIDFEKLKERVGIDMIARHYGWQLREQGDGLVGDCPLCGAYRIR